MSRLTPLLLAGAVLISSPLLAQRASYGNGRGTIDVGRPSYVQPPTGGQILPPAITDSHAYRLGAAISGRPIPGVNGGVVPHPSRPGVIVGPTLINPGFVSPNWGYPFGAPGYWAQPFANGAMANAPIVVHQQNAAPLPVVSVNPDYKPDTAKPVLIEYFAQTPTAANNFAPANNATPSNNATANNNSSATPWKGSLSTNAASTGSAPSASTALPAGNPPASGNLATAVAPTRQHVVALRNGELFKVVAYWTEGEQLFYIKPDHTKGSVRRADVEEIRSW